MMKRILWMLALSFVASAAEADAFRSARHVVRIEMQKLSGESRQFHVQVLDAAERGQVTNMRLLTEGSAPAEETLSAGTTSLTVRVVPYDDSYLVAFTASEGGEIVDQMQAGFTAGPKPEPAAPRMARAGQDVEPPTVLRRVEPLYTDEARSAGAAGTVVIEAVIAPSGFVRDATVLQPMGHGLSESALEAVKQWRFAPTMTDRGPVHVIHEVSIDFKP